ncbi:DUF4296 domain-containing protein [Sphingobacterium endophyticum]|uniref:DUF4296 domain-containing protein n=1 Tax=Sphingobacterium endophyticum TaxID=2546448 RepID=UPI0012E113A3|nr:DUF4296 domain-containing protein [Sphingobacterium endophyticum]
MHRLILGLLPLFFISISCKKNVPEGILSQEDMVELMTEVHILDGYISNIPVDSAKKVIDPLYEQIFDKFGIDSTTFNKNVNYYFGNPALTSKTYDQVVKRLEQKERGFYSRDSLINIHTQDSVNKVTRLQNKLATVSNMIMNALADSTELTIAERTRRFYEPVGLMYYWEKNLFEKKVPVQQPAPDLSSPPKSSDSTQVILPVDNQGEEIKPVEQVDSIPFNRRNERLKPVKRPRERPTVVQ